MLAGTLAVTAAPAQSGWTTPVPETTLNTTASDSGPHLSLDGSTVHFSSFALGNWELFSATRNGPGAPWSTPVHETALGDPAATEDQPFLAANLTELWFASTRAGGAGSFDILRSLRAGPGAPWGAPTFVVELNGPGLESSPSLTADGLELYMLSTSWGAPFAPQNAIFRATRAAVGQPFSTPVLVAELANANSHRDCEIAPDGLSICYTESVGGRLEVLCATRTNRGAAFGAPVILTDFSGVGTGVFSFSLANDRHEALLAASIGGLGQDLLSSTFEGLTQIGAAGVGSTMSLSYRDSANAGRLYVLAAALGTTGFALGNRTVPLDPDWLLEGTFGRDLPPYTAGWSGPLDAAGNGLGTLTNVTPALTGLSFHVGALTLDPTAPFGVATISNTIAVAFQ